MREKKYIIPLKPLAWSRAGINFDNKRFYDKQKHQKLTYGLYLQQQHGNEPMFEIPALEIGFYFKETRHCKTKKNYPHYILKPDIDNCAKFIMDTMKGIIVHDDCVFPLLMAFKEYGKEDQVVIIVRELLKNKKGDNETKKL